MLFGDVRISADELARRLCRNVREAIRPFGERTSDRNWTRAVKGVLYKEGEELNYEVLCNGIDGCYEWMLDVVWWKKMETGIGIALAVECEWGGPGDVIDDFKKLLCIKAPLKVLIYDGGNIPENGARVRTAIEKAMQGYAHHVTGETYLFVGFGHIGEYCHRFVVPRDGVLEGVDFELLIGPEATTKAALA